jgi:hypothetical protein
MANSYLDLTSLDFDTLKSNLKTYLKSQSVFVDYDFEGSNMNVLLDVLSYNSYLNSFYLNMIGSESFLDTAQLRESVISKAKELNYVPISYRSPKAVVDVSFQVLNNSIIDRFEIPKGTQFSGVNANGNFSYVTDKPHILKSAGNIFSLHGLEIYEGQYINETFIVDNSIERQQFVLSNYNVDTESINVTVSEDGNVTGTDYIQTQSLYGLNPNSAVYFIQAVNNQYEIVFGDGIFGRRPVNNATILVTYRITSGTDGSNIADFNIDKDLGGYNGGRVIPSIVVNVPGSAGANAEPIESIRFRAPRHFQTQERAITKNDYKTLILDEFSEIKTLHVYGGEQTDISGINFGKVYISPVTKAGSSLSDSRKNDIISFIYDKMTVGLTPVIINPDFLYIRNDIDIVYDPNKTNYTPNDIQSLASQAISNFNDVNLKDFDIVFRFSKFVDILQNFDLSVVSNSVVPSIFKIISPTLYIDTASQVNYHQEILSGTIFSSKFLLSDGNTYTFTDYNPFKNTFIQAPSGSNFYVQNASNILYLKLDSLSKQTYIPAGSIDYKNGIVSITSINVVDFLDTPGIAIYTETAADDIFAKNNDLIEFDLNYTSQNITVNTP